MAHDKELIWGTYSIPVNQSDFSKSGRYSRFEHEVIIEPLYFEIDIVGGITAYEARGYEWQSDCPAEEKGHDIKVTVKRSKLLRLKQNVNISLDFKISFDLYIPWTHYLKWNDTYFDAFETADEDTEKIPNDPLEPRDRKEFILAKDLREDPWKYPKDGSIWRLYSHDPWDAMKEQMKDGHALLDVRMVITGLRYKDNDIVIKDAAKIESELNRLLRPFMYTAGEAMWNIKKNNEDLQNENEKLKQELEQLRQLKLKLNDNDNVEEEKEQKEQEFDVKIWMKDVVQLEEYSGLLIEEGFKDLESILDLTLDDLKEIGIKKLAHRKKIIKAVEVLKK